MNEDALVKLGLQVLLQDFTEIHTQYPVQPPAQFADAFVSNEAHDPELMWLTLGWLGRMARVLALLEAYTTDVSLEDGRSCQRKQLNLLHTLELEAEAQAREGKARLRVPLPWLWLLTWSRPRTLIRAWGMREGTEDWPRGFYLAPEGFSLGIVVLPELPRTRETLPLRMFGNDDVRRGLRAEYEALAEGDPMRQALGKMLTCWQLWTLGQPQDNKTTRWLMDYMQVVRREMQKIKDEGWREGLKAAEEQLQKIKEEGVREGLKAAEEQLQKIKEEGVREGLKAAEEQLQKIKEEGVREGLKAAEEQLQKIKEEGVREGLKAAEEQLQKIKEEAERAKMLASVEMACDLLGIEMTEERRAHLAGLDLAGLDALRLRLKSERAWPLSRDAVDHPGERGQGPLAAKLEQVPPREDLHRGTEVLREASSVGDGGDPVALTGKDDQPLRRDHRGASQRTHHAKGRLQGLVLERLLLRCADQAATFPGEVREGGQRDQGGSEGKAGLDGGQERGGVAAQAHPQHAHRRSPPSQQPPEQPPDVLHRLAEALDGEARVARREHRAAQRSAAALPVEGQHEEGHVEPLIQQPAYRHDPLLDGEIAPQVPVDHHHRRAPLVGTEEQPSQGDVVLLVGCVARRDALPQRREAAAPAQVADVQPEVQGTDPGEPPVLRGGLREEARRILQVHLLAVLLPDGVQRFHALLVAQPLGGGAPPGALAPGQGGRVEDLIDPGGDLGGQGTKGAAQHGDRV
jgi:hypothetical protein